MCHSHVVQPGIGSPVGNGWKIGPDNILEPVFYLKDASPIEVRYLTHLYCTDTGCDGVPRCHCCASGLYCTEFCSCNDQECGNVKECDLNSENEDDDDI